MSLVYSWSISACAIFGEIFDKITRQGKMIKRNTFLAVSFGHNLGICFKEWDSGCDAFNFYFEICLTLSKSC